MKEDSPNDKVYTTKFIEYRCTTKSTPMVLTKDQVDQIMKFDNGGNIMSRCLIVHLLNQQLYEAGVLV